MGLVLCSISSIKMSSIDLLIGFASRRLNKQILTHDRKRKYFSQELIFGKYPKGYYTLIQLSSLPTIISKGIHLSS